MENKQIEWNKDKDQRLKDERGVGFEDVVQKITDGKITDVIKNPNQK